MKYIAKKPCNFGKKYFIGEEIPAEKILNPTAQKMMGVIEVVEGDSRDADPEEGGRLLPPSPTLEEADIEEEISEDTEEAEERTGRVCYTKNQLDRKTKDELLAIAEELGVDAADDPKKADLIALIIEAQEV